MRLVVLLFALFAFCVQAFADDWRVNRKVAGNFADTREAVVMAIENRGLVINQVSHIGEMLDRTGTELGLGGKIYDQAEIIEFCSAKLSRKMMEADPHNIVLCPFTIAIYTLPGKTGESWVGYRRPMGVSAAMVEGLLAEILGEVAP